MISQNPNRHNCNCYISGIQRHKYFGKKKPSSQKIVNIRKEQRKIAEIMINQGRLKL